METEEYKQDETTITRNYLQKGDEVFCDGVYLEYDGEGKWKLRDINPFSWDAGMWLDGTDVIYFSTEEPFTEKEVKSD